MLQHECALQIDRAVQAARELKMTFEQSPGRSELIDDFFSVQIRTSINVLACYNPARMPPYPNLVSDSTLVQDTIDLLTGSGGRAAASEIVDAVFKLSHIDD